MASTAKRRTSPPRAGGPISKEEGFIGADNQRKFLKAGNVFIKRCLRPHELFVKKVDWHSGPQTIVIQGRQPMERLQNEAACLRFIRANTSIPVPAIICDFEDDKAYYLMTEYVEGVNLNDLPLEQQKFVEGELQEHAATMQTLRSKRLGGPTGIFIYPSRVQPHYAYGQKLDLREADDDVFVFTHGDYRKANVIVDPDTLKIRAILDWEFAGFFPKFFERPWYMRDGPAGPLDGEEDDRDNIVEFFRRWTKGEPIDTAVDSQFLDAMPGQVNRVDRKDIQRAKAAKAAGDAQDLPIITKAAATSIRWPSPIQAKS